ncbi:MAG: hypothetical protein JWN42_2621, partial [Candidatus Angelobacter sp.]|nr:hypothetical protein [Candidatus Angelobacter sp.]
MDVSRLTRIGGRVCIALAVVLLHSNVLPAQSSYASLTGRALDPGNAVIADA